MHLRSVLPVAEWLPQYQRDYLVGDFVAGATLAAYAIPVSLAYASLAGLPPEAGMYCYLAGGMGYAFLGTSHHLAIGPTSAISLVLGVSLAGIADGDTSRTAALASLVALATAGVFLLAWVFKLSVLVNFISESILIGFKAGAALTIATTQLPKLLGVSGGGDSFFERVWLLLQQLDSANWLTVAFGMAALIMLVAGGLIAPRWPIALLVLLVAIGTVWFWGLDRQGLAVVGDIHAGLPGLRGVTDTVAKLDIDDGRQIARLAAACFLLAYIESISAARTFALQHKYEVNPRQELLGLGAASALAGLFQGFPVAGGLSQTAVNERAGARTQISLLFCSAAIGCVLLFLTAYFRTLPDAVLAAVVLVAIKGLFDVRQVAHLWRASRQDFAAAAVAFAGVLLMGVLDGVMIAVLASILMLLAKVSRPNVAFLGRIPGTSRFSDLARHPTNERLPGTMIFRVQSSLLYFNVDYVLRVVREQAARQSDLQRVICDLSNVPTVDIAGARLLLQLYEEFHARRVAFEVVEAHATVREILRAEGLDKLVGPITRLESLAGVLERETPPE